MDWAKTTARWDKKHLSFGIWCTLYQRFDGTSDYIVSVPAWPVVCCIWHATHKKTFVRKSHQHIKHIIVICSTNLIPLCLWMEAIGNYIFNISTHSTMKSNLTGVDKFWINSKVGHLQILTILVLRTFLETRSILWLLLPWLFASPGHQQLSHWVCMVSKFLSSTRKDFNCLSHISVAK